VFLRRKGRSRGAISKGEKQMSGSLFHIFPKRAFRIKRAQARTLDNSQKKVIFRPLKPQKL
jgi:hypothetical protein